MRTYTEADLKEILDKHRLWADGEMGGERAYLRGADLQRAYLRGADLQRAYLRGADLQHAYLRGADLRGADLRGADLQRAYLRGADLQHADLRGADLRGADLQHADLRGADLRGADLRGADLQRAYLQRAYLQHSYLRGARGLSPESATPLLILLEQPGKIHAYKLVNEDFASPIQSSGKLTYNVGDTLTCEDANTDPNEQCAEGINLCTLDWCLREWRDGYHVMVCEFTAKDIACIPNATDGKFRVRKCKVVSEYDLTEMFEREAKEREEWEKEVSK